MNLPALLRRDVTAPLGARLSLFTRRLALLTLAACALAFAPQARAANIDAETPPDTIDVPPAPVANHCTLRKAVMNANANGMASPFPQCQAGEGGGVVDVINFLSPGPYVFALAGANEDGAATGDLDITDNLTIIGHPDGTTIDANNLDRSYSSKPSNSVRRPR